MSKVIRLDERLKLTAKQRRRLERRRRIIAVHNVFQCTQCASKCQRCGASMGPHKRDGDQDTQVPYNFCESCAEEYVAYINHLQGKHDPDDYWYSHAWLKVWQTWIEYQGAKDLYLRSKEFRRLLFELRARDSSD